MFCGRLLNLNIQYIEKHYIFYLFYFFPKPTGIGFQHDTNLSKYDVALQKYAR